MQNEKLHITLPNSAPSEELYRFGADGNLRLYSYDRLFYSLYGYDGGTTRTYKYSFDLSPNWVNGRLENVSFNPHTAMFYPNAYINFNSNGYYTKHYYNGMERIASRLGDQNLQIHTHDPELQDRKWQLDSNIRRNIVGITGYEFLPVGEEQTLEDPKPIFELPVIGISNLQPSSDGIYYYHPNHLGSTCYVTDGNARVQQGFLYAPFGEITNEHNSSFGSSVLPKYSFNAKELDEETGMYYYEARYYQPPVFTSRDRLFEKYPTISPYTYCANNPIKYIDPSGDSIVINGTIYQVGMKYDGKDVFTKKTIDALNNIYNNGGYEGAELVNTLCYSKNTFYIKQREGVVSEFIEKSTTAACARNIQTLISDWLIADQHGLTTGSGGDIMWNTNGYYIFTEKGLKNNPVYQLLHELCHAYDANFGIMNDGLFNGLELYEWSACLRANCIGSYMGYPMQTVYEGVADEYGEHIPGTGTKLFEENGDQINPF